MSRRRYISTEISKDKRFNALAMKSDFAALLYVLLVVWSLDDATVDADPEEVLYEVIPGRRDKTEQDVCDALELIHEAGLLEAICESRIYFHLASYYKYQSYIPAAKRRETPQNADDYPTTPQNPAFPSLSLSPSLSKDKPLSFEKYPVPGDVLGYWSDKAGRDPVESDLRSLKSIVSRFGAEVTKIAIGQSVIQGSGADNFGLITTIAKAESA